MRTTNTEKFATAFELVCPAKHAVALAKAGLISAACAATVTWKAPIGALILDVEIEAAGLTIDDVRDAIEFYTATKATTRRAPIGKRSGQCDGEGRMGYLVTAEGYAKGPAGDH